MMKPRIGKTEWWDKVSPSEQKEIDKRARNWVVVKWLHRWHDPNYWEPQERWCVTACKDDFNLRFSVAREEDAKILMEKLSKHDAQMWAKMMD
jgi:hypothetical protein